MPDQVQQAQSLDYITKTGADFYMDELREKLEKTDLGKYAVIEPNTKSYFVHEDLLEALQEAEDKFPDNIFFIVHIGSLYPTSNNYKKNAHEWLF
jgi:hypothetical protein